MAPQELGGVTFRSRCISFTGGGALTLAIVVWSNLLERNDGDAIPNIGYTSVVFNARISIVEDVNLLYSSVIHYGFSNNSSSRDSFDAGKLLDTIHYMVDDCGASSSTALALSLLP